MAHLPYPSDPRPARGKRRPRSRIALGGGVAATAIAIGVITASGGTGGTSQRPAPHADRSGTVDIGAVERPEAR
ncbi:hypothetical protein ACFV9W_10435 [Streptomyces sp. NPDC059897]|uniref:hypothetical protein n=1 Tax=Streptomyces sp. NPDC059897 TaxID=3346994 RepID=UPI003660EB10